MREQNNPPLNVHNRIEWIDLAKGLGVLLVVIGHLWYNCLFPVVNHIIYSFHMPMFFVLSGFVFKKGNSKFSSFLAVKSKRLLLPTFIFFILGAAFLLLFSNHSFLSILRRFLFIDGLCPYNAPCWYFITLFQLVILSYFLNLNEYSYTLKTLVMVTAFILGFFIYKFDIYIPFGINRTIIAMVFFVFGSILRQAHQENRKLQNTLFETLIYIGFMVFWIVFGVVLNDKISFYQMDIDNYFFFILAGICGSIVFIKFSTLLQKTETIKRFLIKTSDNSIVIIGTHYFVIYVFECIMEPLGLFKTWPYCLIVICFSICTILIYNSIRVFIKKHVRSVR